MEKVKSRSLFIILSLLANVISAQESTRRVPAWRGLSRRPSRTIQKPIPKTTQRRTTPTRPARSITTPTTQARMRTATAQNILKAATPAQQKAYLASAKAIRERMAQIRKRIRERKEKEPAPFVGLETEEIDIVGIEEIPDSEDHFTQSEAHLNEQSVRYLIKQNYPNIEMLLNIISQVLIKEEKYKNTHYAFYHALDNVWIATQDVYKKLHAYLRPMTVGVEDFQFLRWGSIGYEGTAQEFLMDQLKNHGLIDDNKSSVRAFLLSVNLALFGNVGYPGECTWHYFMQPTSHVQPNEAIFKSILDVFGIDHKYVDQLMKLSDLIQTKEQTLLQIFIPISKVDEIAYLALVRGIPAHEETINWVLKNVRSKRYIDVKPTLDKITDIYKTENVQNPAFKDLIEKTEKGDFSIHNLLKVYRNTPWKIPNLNYLQGRLLLTQDVLLNPDSGVTFYRYSTITRKQKKAYDEALDKLINEIVGAHLEEAAEESFDEELLEESLNE